MNPKEVFGKNPECPPVEVLAMGGGAVERHLAACAYCRNELALMNVFEAAEASAEESPSVAWIADRLHSPIPAPPTPRRRAWAWMPRWIPVVFAACLLVAVYVAVRPHTAVAPPPAGGDVWRGSFRAISPAGDVAAAPREFTWSAMPQIRTYRVALMEVDPHEIWSARTNETHIAVPPDVLAQMTPGRTFLWQVSAEGAPDGLAETSLQEFHIATKLP